MNPETVQSRLVDDDDREIVARPLAGPLSEPHEQRQQPRNVTAGNRTHRTPVTAMLLSFSCSISSTSMAKLLAGGLFRSGRNVFAFCCLARARPCTSAIIRSGAVRPSTTIPAR